MQSTTQIIPQYKNIALIAHDHCKQVLIDWLSTHVAVLSKYTLYATCTTGNMIEQATKLVVNNMLSGPLGGKQGIGAFISEKNRCINFLLGSIKCSLS